MPRLARVIVGVLAALALAGAAEAQSSKVRIATEGAYPPWNATRKGWEGGPVTGRPGLRSLAPQ